MADQSIIRSSAITLAFLFPPGWGDGQESTALSNTRPDSSMRMPVSSGSGEKLEPYEYSSFVATLATALSLSDVPALLSGWRTRVVPYLGVRALHFSIMSVMGSVFVWGPRIILCDCMCSLSSDASDQRLLVGSDLVFSYTASAVGQNTN
eukprot:CAMPEP_0206524814 /NCGR_PEP_ID=MMETSP0324_2-20121206/68383_1 /ASSEMBLY_ACC=CAM_ASM_000836 /TAXON_ID=2866 /ORGANISM="Crypthecodinium cohnii, Strain Seligo" /LENGTH=149 /DNA_ID=CAMNT_0054019403 /DNA_START=190 /DNA_END=636 /DNA_ORIENTATION=-